jgi:hypothetical protein
MSRINEKLLEELTAKDDLVFKLGDTLDMKSSIVLVVITFLGTQTAYFFDKHPSGLAHSFQVASVMFLALATLAAIVGLWPRNYWMTQPEKLVTNRIEELTEYFSKESGDLESNVLGQLGLDEIGWATKRIADNKIKNTDKAHCLYTAFAGTALALLCNVLTLVWFTHPF